MRNASQMPSKPHASGKTCYKASLLLCVSLLTACATTSPPIAVSCPALPAMPSEITLPRSQTFSENVQADLLTWRQRLTGLLEK